MPASLSLPALTGASLVLAAATSCTSVPMEQAHHDWHEEPHHVSLLTATTIEDGESAATVGVDYEYRVNGLLGIGAVFEHAFEPLDATTILAVADLHLTPHLIVQTGPGFEHRESGDFFVYRVGMLYEWIFPSGLTLSPQLHYDATSEEDAVVVGLALGFGF